MADNLLLNCPLCQQPFRISEQLAGKNVRCPHCARTLVIPNVNTPKTLPSQQPTQLPQFEHEFVQSNPTILAQQKQSIHYSCPKCQQPGESPTTMAGQKIACSFCGQRLQIPDTTPSQETKTILAVPQGNSPVSPQSQTAAPRLQPDTSATMVYCMLCGHRVSSEATACPSCGHPIRSQLPFRPQTPRNHQLQRPGSGLAIWFTIMLPTAIVALIVAIILFANCSYTYSSNDSFYDSQGVYRTVYQTRYAYDWFMHGWAVFFFCSVVCCYFLLKSFFLSGYIKPGPWYVQLKEVCLPDLPLASCLFRFSTSSGFSDPFPDFRLLFKKSTRNERAVHQSLPDMALGYRLA